MPADHLRSARWSEGYEDVSQRLHQPNPYPHKEGSTDLLIDEEEQTRAALAGHPPRGPASGRGGWHRSADMSRRHPGVATSTSSRRLNPRTELSLNLFMDRSQEGKCSFPVGYQAEVSKAAARLR